MLQSETFTRYEAVLSRSTSSVQYKLKCLCDFKPVYSKQKPLVVTKTLKSQRPGLRYIVSVGVHRDKYELKKYLSLHPLKPPRSRRKVSRIGHGQVNTKQQAVQLWVMRFCHRLNELYS